MKKLADISAFERLGQIQYSSFSIFNDRNKAVEFVSQVDSLGRLYDVYTGQVWGLDKTQVALDVGTSLYVMMLDNQGDIPFTKDELSDAIYIRSHEWVPKGWVQDIVADAFRTAQRWYSKR